MIEPWMQYAEMLANVFQQPGAYTFPFGAHNLQVLYDASDAELSRWSLPRVRDQAVSVDLVFAHFKGKYQPC